MGKGPRKQPGHPGEMLSPEQVGSVHCPMSPLQAAEAWEKYNWFGPCDWPRDKSELGPWVTAPLRLYTPNAVMTKGGNSRVLIGRRNAEAGRHTICHSVLPVCSRGSVSTLVAALTALCCGALCTGSLLHWTVSALRAGRLSCPTFQLQHL